MEEDRIIQIKCRIRRVIGIYGKGDNKFLQDDEWIDKVFQLLRYQDRVAIRDWNAHYEKQGLIRKSNKRGKLLDEAVEKMGTVWAGLEGPT